MELAYWGGREECGWETQKIGSRGRETAKVAKPDWGLNSFVFTKM